MKINKNPVIIINGINTHNKIMTSPMKMTKIWNKIPTIIKTILINAPKNLENKLEMRVLRNSPTSYHLG